MGKSYRIKSGWFAFALTMAMVWNASSAQADVMAYASATDNNLYQVDLTTATSTLIGHTGLTVVEGMALSSNGTLYATDSGGFLYTLSTTTGAVTSTIGNTGLGDVEGLSFAGSTLVATNYSKSTSLYTLDTGTAAATPLATVAGVEFVRGATTVSPTSGYVLGYSTSNTVPEQLFSVDQSGNAVTIGPINVPLSAALGYSASDRTLYALGDDGTVYTVSTTTGAFTATGNTGDHFYLDMAIIPATAAVPEPSSLALCVVAVAAGTVIRLRRRGLRA
jgi:uncharacterized protein YjiK